jgi:hypothetical protein
MVNTQTIIPLFATVSLRQGCREVEPLVNLHASRYLQMQFTVAEAAQLGTALLDAGRQGGGTDHAPTHSEDYQRQYEHVHVLIERFSDVLFLLEDFVRDTDEVVRADMTRLYEFDEHDEPDLLQHLAATGLHARATERVLRFTRTDLKKAMAHDGIALPKEVLEPESQTQP